MKTRRADLAVLHHRLDALRVEAKAGTITLDELDAAEQAVRLAEQALRDAESLQHRGAERQAVAKAMYMRELVVAQDAWVHARLEAHRPALVRLRSLLLEAESLVADLAPDSETMARECNRAPFAGILTAFDRQRVEQAMTTLSALLPEAPAAPARKATAHAARQRPMAPPPPVDPWNGQFPVA